MRIHTDRLKEETQGFGDIINPFDTPPTARLSSPKPARGMSRTVNITEKVQNQVEKERFHQGLVSLFVSRSILREPQDGEEARTTTA